MTRNNIEWAACLPIETDVAAEDEAAELIVSCSLVVGIQSQKVVAVVAGTSERWEAVGVAEAGVACRTVVVALVVVVEPSFVVEAAAVSFEVA